MYQETPGDSVVDNMAPQPELCTFDGSEDGVLERLWHDFLLHIFNGSLVISPLYVVYCGAWEGEDWILVRIYIDLDRQVASVPYININRLQIHLYEQ